MTLVQRFFVLLMVACILPFTVGCPDYSNQRAVPNYAQMSDPGSNEVDDNDGSENIDSPSKRQNEDSDLRRAKPKFSRSAYSKGDFWIFLIPTLIIGCVVGGIVWKWQVFSRLIARIPSHSESQTDIDEVVENENHKGDESFDSFEESSMKLQEDGQRNVDDLSELPDEVKQERNSFYSNQELAHEDSNSVVEVGGEADPKQFDPTDKKKTIVNSMNKYEESDSFFDDGFDMSVEIFEQEIEDVDEPAHGGSDELRLAPLDDRNPSSLGSSPSLNDLTAKLQASEQIRQQMQRHLDKNIEKKKLLKAKVKRSLNRISNLKKKLARKENESVDSEQLELKDERIRELERMLALEKAKRLELQDKFEEDAPSEADSRQDHFQLKRQLSDVEFEREKLKEDIVRLQKQLDEKEAQVELAQRTTMSNDDTETSDPIQAILAAVTQTNKAIANISRRLLDSQHQSNHMSNDSNHSVNGAALREDDDLLNIH